eukprot:g27888.t1
MRAFLFQLWHRSVAPLKTHTRGFGLPRRRLECRFFSTGGPGQTDHDRARAFVLERGYTPAIADGIMAALKSPGAGIPQGRLYATVQEMAGRWEVGEDAGLHSLAKSALSEAPLVCVSMDESRACSVILEMEDSWEALLGYPALLYWAALQTLTESEVNGAFQGGVSLEVQELALQLWAPLRETELSEGVTTVLKSLWREPVRGLALKVERLLKIWVFNSLRCGEWVILPLLTAMCSHDCSPNAFWNFDLEQKIIELRAGEHIQQGMELKISYLSSGVLWLPVLERRHRLEITKEFVCTCERCSNQWDDARVFVCPRCQGDAFATPKATCVGAEGVEGTEGAEGAERGWWKLKGAVVELCSEEEEPAACVACASCGPLSCVEAASFLVPEKDLAELLLRTPQLATALAGDSILEESAAKAVEAMKAHLVDVEVCKMGAAVLYAMVQKTDPASPERLMMRTTKAHQVLVEALQHHPTDRVLDRACRVTMPELKG